NNDHIIKEGMFDQEIFVLIKGKLDVLIKTENGDEEQIDVISQSFSLFGERCILGEQRAASIIASGDVTLLGIDLSSLPDLQEGLDDPEKRVEETRYQQSIDMYNVFSSVLIERLDRLLKDQYKLMHKIMRLHEFQDFWENNILVTLIFNEFATNQLHSDLKVGEILQKAVGKNCQQSPQLAEALKEDKINTEIVYIELVRLYSLGIIKELNNLILGITKQLADAAFKIPHYLNQIKAPIYRLPDMLSLADYLGDVFNAINDSERLTKPIEKKDLLEGYLFGNTLNPLALSDYLVEHHYVETKYDLAYVMYLACQCCIYKVGDINKVIGKYVKHLTSLNSPPMQNINSAKGRFDSLVDDMTRMQKVYMESPQESGISIIKDDQEQDSVEDLLSQYGM
ncbi:MAG: cyclic nucleotide-binding domain-containing protein, partial [Deltaproteobacteria bacterium]|nr:cyclic nucleotide-binding domain-containing protein [Deltaproteobacteria bacterium]